MCVLEEASYFVYLCVCVCYVQNLVYRNLKYRGAVCGWLVLSSCGNGCEPVPAFCRRLNVRQIYCEPTARELERDGNVRETNVYS